MLQKIKTRVRIFTRIYFESLDFFFKHWNKLIIIASGFFVPAFLVDKYLTLHENFLRSCHVFVWVDWVLNFVAVVFFFIYLVVIFRFFYLAEKRQYRNIFSLCHDAKKYIVPFLRVQFLSMAKVFLWSFAFLLPGVFFFFLYSFSGISILCEGKKDKEALIYSKTLISSHLSEYFDHLILLAMFQCASISLFLLTLDLLKQFLYYRELFLFEKIISFFVMDFFVMLVIIFCQIFFYNLYQELKGRLIYH